jgi:FkbM family methyltransferase
MMTLQLDEYTDSAIFLNAFEYTTCRAISTVLKPGDTFVDVGAHIGFFTLLAASIVGEKGRIVAFEPNVSTRARLIENVNQNGWGDRVSVRPWGLSEESTTVDLCIPNDPNLATSHASMRAQDDWRSYHRQSIEVRRLDDVWSPQDPIHLVKFDIEGAELLALRGASQTIKATRPHVICEFNNKTAAAFGYDPMEIVEFFTREIGDYGIHILTSRRIIRNPPWRRDALSPPKIENWWFYPLPPEPQGVSCG